MPSTSPSSGPFQNFQAFTPQLPRAKTHSQPKQISIIRPKLQAFAFSHQENIHPHTQPTTILLPHRSSFHSPQPDSVSHMSYTRPSSWPHGSHCTRIPGWIPLSGPVPDASPRYSSESSRAQGLRSDSYPPTLAYSYLCSSAASTQDQLNRQ